MVNPFWRNLPSTPCITVLICFHIAVDLVLVLPSWFLNQTLLLVAMGIPLGQLALLALWSVFIPKTAWIKCFVPACGTIACWYLLSLILPWGLSEGAPAGWAFVLVVQVLTIFFFIKLYRLSNSGLPSNHSKFLGPDQKEHFRFGIRSVLLWTTVFGISFAFIQFGRQTWLWTAEIFQWEHMNAVPLIGMTNGILAVLWLWPFASRELIWLVSKILAAVLGTFVLAIFQYHASEWVTGAKILELKESLIFVGVQGLVIFSSLLVATVFSLKKPSASVTSSTVRQATV